jgi:hypothetical protein
MNIPQFSWAGSRGAAYLRWIVPALVCAAPTAAIGLLMYAPDLGTELEIVGILVVVLAGFGELMVTASRLGWSQVDSWLRCVEIALWLKAAGAVLLVGLAVDLFSAASVLAMLQWLPAHNLSPPFPVLGSFWQAPCLSLIVMVVVLTQVAFLTIGTWLVRDHGRGARILSRWFQRNVG